MVRAAPRVQPTDLPVVVFEKDTAMDRSSALLPAVLVPILCACAQSASPAPSLSAPAVPMVSAPLVPAQAPSALPLGSVSVPPPAPTKPPAQCSLPPTDMVLGNLGATDSSGLAEIVASSKMALDRKSPAPSTGYVSFRYEVRILKWFAGTGPEHMVLWQGAEADFNPAKAGKLLFFSACKSSDASFHEPDVGYFFALEPDCRTEAEALGAEAAKKARKSRSACSK